MNTFSERLNEALTIRNMTAAELSKKTQIAEAAISHYKKGTYVPKIINTGLIAQALNVSEAWIMGYDVPMERDNKNKSPIISNEELDKDIIEIIPFLKKIQKADPAYFDSVYKTLKAYSAQLEAKDISETKR